MRGISFILAMALVASTAAVRIADAAVEGEVRSKDKVLGTILPGAEVESWSIACPVDSKLKVILKGPKKSVGGAVSFRVLDPNKDEILGLPITPKGTGAKLSRYEIPESGEYTVQVFATDGETGGDYVLKIVCNPPKKLTFEATLDGSEMSFPFYAALGTQVKATLKPAAGSTAGPILVRIDGPNAYTAPINVGPPKGVASPKIVLDETGDFELFFDGTGGAVVGTIKIKPLKSANRTLDVKSSTIDPDGQGGSQAVVGVVGPGGGSVMVPPNGGGPGDLAGTGIDIPPGALDVPVAIVIATAPPIGPPPNTDPVGNTTFFGPEGLQFSQDATLTLPFDPTLVESADDVRVYTRDANGNVTLIDPATYVVDLIAGTVTVPTAHFSAFAVFRLRDPLTVETVIGELPNTPTDVISFRGGFGQDIGFSVSDDVKAGIVTPFGEQYLVAHGEVIDQVVVDPFGEGPEVFRLAGGGENTQPGAFGPDFDFPGPITALATDGFTVFASTATQVFRLLYDFEGSYYVYPHAGTGAVGDSGDDGDPLAATFTNIVDLLVPPARNGELLVLDRGATRLRLTGPNFAEEGDDIITTLLGTGTPGVGPDGALPDSSPLLDPTCMCIGPEFGEVFVADAGRIRLVQVIEGGIIVGPPSLHGGDGIQNHTFAGPVDGTQSGGADGVPRLSTGFWDVAGMAYDFQGRRLLVTDRGTHTVQDIPVAPGGIVRTLIGLRGFSSPLPGDFTAPGVLSFPGACLIDSVNLVFIEEGTLSLRCSTIGTFGLRGDD